MHPIGIIEDSDCYYCFILVIEATVFHLSQFAHIKVYFLYVRAVDRDVRRLFVSHI